MEENSTTYKCLIIDDESLACQLIQLHLAQFAWCELVAVCTSTKEAGMLIEKQPIDLIFLDIEMPNQTGIEFLKELKYAPKVIMTTAYSEFALDAFELNVLDYILKPVTFERFDVAMKKAHELFELERNSKVLSTMQKEKKSILIKTSHQLVRILIADILFIEGLHKYVKIVCADKTYTTLGSLTVMETDLIMDGFYRCHRSFIINLSKVVQIEGLKVNFGSHSAAISKLNKAELVSKLREF
jgi:DNA-binding LytR/AlgR family response regulator